jgi:hypothetical protein
VTDVAPPRTRGGDSSVNTVEVLLPTLNATAAGLPLLLLLLPLSTLRQLPQLLLLLPLTTLLESPCWCSCSCLFSLPLLLLLLLLLLLVVLVLSSLSTLK